MDEMTPRSLILGALTTLDTTEPIRRACRVWQTPSEPTVAGIPNRDVASLLLKGSENKKQKSTVAMVTPSDDMTTRSLISGLLDVAAVSKSAAAGLQKRKSKVIGKSTLAPLSRKKQRQSIGDNATPRMVIEHLLREAPAETPVQVHHASNTEQEQTIPRTHPVFHGTDVLIASLSPDVPVKEDAVESYEGTMAHDIVTTEPPRGVQRTLDTQGVSPIASALGPDEMEYTEYLMNKNPSYMRHTSHSTVLGSAGLVSYPEPPVVSRINSQDSYLFHVSQDEEGESLGSDLQQRQTPQSTALGSVQQSNGLMSYLEPPAVSRSSQDSYLFHVNQDEDGESLGSDLQQRHTPQGTALGSVQQSNGLMSYPEPPAVSRSSQDSYLSHVSQEEEEESLASDLQQRQTPHSTALGSVQQSNGLMNATEPPATTGSSQDSYVFHVSQEEEEESLGSDLQQSRWRGLVTPKVLPVTERRPLTDQQQLKRSERLDKSDKKLPSGKTRRTSRKQTPQASGYSPGLPSSLVKSIFQHFSAARVSKEALTAVEQGSNLFFKQLSSDLMAYCGHAGRQTIELCDVELLMKRQGLVTGQQSLCSLIEKYLPLEYRQELIPVVQSGNKVVLK